jgi:hypothetical protein
LISSAGVEFVKVALVDSLDEARERFTECSGDSSRPEHKHAAILLDRAEGPDALAEIYARLEDVVGSRPNTR